MVNNVVQIVDLIKDMETVDFVKTVPDTYLNELAFNIRTTLVDENAHKNAFSSNFYHKFG